MAESTTTWGISRCLMVLARIELAIAALRASQAVTSLHHLRAECICQEIVWTLLDTEERSSKNTVKSDADGEFGLGRKILSERVASVYTLQG